MRDETIHDDQLAKDLQTRNCPVCNKIWDNVMNFFSSWGYSLANDEETQKENADFLGICPFHTWQLASIASPQGISSGYEALVKRISKELYRLSVSLENPCQQLSTIIIGRDHCRICALTRETEGDYIKRLASFLTVEDNKNIYLSSNGLCLRHLSKLLIISNTDMKKVLLKHAASRFRDWAEDMNQFSLKHKNLQRHQCSPRENNAYLTALNHLAGGKYTNIDYERQ
ncbi:MAG: hypothetical protein KBG22_11515 [Smithella sp.]|nr:hypothetical protein [Smithella sp.]HOU51253.1 hypothetical protein [Smithella sp.]HQG65555.1 hypothetical protein [Smithella sp.]HQH16473.1 hypothetical protein [Smithella sp.]HQI72813.1 hypothetical protein [Smithella sp.]